MCIRDSSCPCSRRHQSTNTEQKQIQEHSTAELGLLRGELNKQVTKISKVQESIILKIAEVEKSVEC